MVAVDKRTPTGTTAGPIELDDEVFGVQPNIPVMEQVVVAQLAARRAGSQHTKTRAEVRGGGAKPWRQKGTGRARQGSTRSPHWRGGGVALGPKPRSFAQRTPKKMIRLALRSALSDRAADGKVIVLDSWGITEAKTKSAQQVLAALGVEGKVLVVVTLDDREAWLSLRNLPDVHVLVTAELNAYDVLVSDWVIFTEASLPVARASKSDDAPEPSEATAVETAVAVGSPAEAEESA